MTCHLVPDKVNIRLTPRPDWQSIWKGAALSLGTNLAHLLARRPDGIFVAPFEQGEIGPDLFRAACNMGVEGLVSKRVDYPYRARRSKDWIKIKNRQHPTYRRVQD